MHEIRTILLVEDSLADAEMTIDALREARLANPIVHVEDGVEALDYLRMSGRFSTREDGNPGVVLLDIKMPRMDGIEVLREIRADDNLRRIPVVILSSSREERDLAALAPVGPRRAPPRSGRGARSGDGDPLRHRRALQCLGVGHEPVSPWPRPW